MQGRKGDTTLEFFFESSKNVDIHISMWWQLSMQIETSIQFRL
jgi:hypothetical protein